MRWVTKSARPHQASADAAQRKRDEAFSAKWRKYFDRRHEIDATALEKGFEIRPGFTKDGRNWRNREL